MIEQDKELDKYICDNIKQLVEDSREVFGLIDNPREMLKGERLWLLYNLLKKYETWSLVVVETYPFVEDCFCEGAPLPVTNCTPTIKPLMVNRQSDVQDRLALKMLEMYIKTGYEFLITVLDKFEQEEKRR